MGRGATYFGVFLVAMATLMLEILIIRIISVIAWYHLAFFVISLAMLGLTAGAILVFLWPKLFPAEKAATRLAQSSLWFALSIPLALMIALRIPMNPVTDAGSFLSLLMAGSAWALPFIAGGVTITLALTQAGLPAGKVYGIDLCGAAAGCASVIIVLRFMDAPSGAIFAGAVAALAAVFFAYAAGSRLHWAGLAVAGLTLLTLANAASSPPPLRPTLIKGKHEDAGTLAYARWNTYSRVTMTRPRTVTPFFWSVSPRIPEASLQPVNMSMILIDSLAGTAMAIGPMPVTENHYLGWDMPAFAQFLRPTGPAAVIGVGGGRDILEALRAGHKPVVGLEINDLIVGLHDSEFSDLARHPDVEIVADEARSYLNRETRRFDLITMSLVDTWAASAVGAYSLSENGLYTVEGWETFLSRLTPAGIFTVSRWYVPASPVETARMIALAMQALWSTGADHPQDHMVLIYNPDTSGRVLATLLVSPSPLSDADLRLVDEMTARLGYKILVAPGRRPENSLLRELTAQATPAAMMTWAGSQAMDLYPSTDNRPFFFNTLKPGDWLRSDLAASGRDDPSVLGNLQATQTLIYATLVALILTVVTIVLPLLWRRRSLPSLGGTNIAAAALYFAAIGLGFMFVQMGLLSRLNVLLGHPTLALVVVLGSIIFFTGMGSLLSTHIPLNRGHVRVVYPLIPAALILAGSYFMLPLMSWGATGGLAVRAAISILLIAPVGLGLGLCFPLGLRIVTRLEASHAGGKGGMGPWLWGINGAFGVCAGGLALATSMVWGIQTTMIVGSLCYTLLPLCTYRLIRSAE
jgi:hypothetical protein